MIDKHVFFAEIVILMDWFNRSFEEKTIDRLHQRLSQHLTTEQFQEAALIVFDKARFFPTVEEFVEAVKGNPATVAIEEWGKCLKAASSANSAYITDISPAGKFALQKMGDISGLGQLTEDQHSWKQKEFVAFSKEWRPSGGVANLPAASNDQNRAGNHWH